jgi:hypothetical protein
MAFAAPIMQRKAVTVNITAKPLSPMVMDFELEAWLMRVLSSGDESNNHSPGERDLIEIKLARSARSASRQAEHAIVL